MQIFLPQIGLFWVWRGNVRSRAGWLLKTIIVGVYIIDIALAGLWLYLPWLTPAFYMLLLFSASYQAYRTVASSKKWLPTWTIGEVLRTTISFVWATVLIGHTAYLFSGWRLPDAVAVELKFPLDNGTYYVTNGGTNRILNEHLAPAAMMSAGFYVEAYAVDILKLESLGRRGSATVPHDLFEYEIYGEPVYAPCSGTVVHSEGGLPDLIPPDKDPSNAAGNHIIIACKGVLVILQHLKNGSIRTSIGQSVERGQRIAKVGNSGLTSEPHLQIHAQRIGTQGLAGEPLPIKFNGRFLVRNSLVLRNPVHRGTIGMDAIFGGAAADE